MRLVERGLGGKLVLVVAPLGSGKTTLLNQWFASVAARRTVAWLLCEERDDEPARFFACLAAAIGRAVSGFDARVSSRASERLRYSADHITHVLLDRLGATQRELTIVIDDFQWIANPNLSRAFSSLLLRSPAHVHWLIASRQAPRFDLGRLKLDDQLTMIGSADLNFQPEHVGALAKLLHGIDLSGQEAADCCRCTEGWIAGVKLALLCSRENSPRALQRFSWFNRDTVSYLAESVLDGQPPAIREFLLASCIVDRMSGELCNALLGIDNAAALLQGLQRSQLFIQPLDAEHRWFRYHSLFLEFLRDTLRRDAPERVAALHKSASAWLIEHELIEDGLRHAFATDDRAWCIELIGRCVPAWLRTGEFAEVLQWTAHLTSDEIVSSRAICTAHLMSLIFSRQFERARGALAAAQEAALRPADTALQHALETYRLLLAVMMDAAPELTMQDIDKLNDPGDPYLTANLLNVSAYYMLVNRKFGSARRLALRGQDLLRGTNHSYTAAQTQIVVMLIDRAEGRAKAAANSCVQLYVRAQEGRRNPIWVTAATAAASVHYHHNRLEEADALCSEILPFLTIAPSMENFTVAYVIAARLKCASGRHREALFLLDYLHGVLEGLGCRRLLAQVCFEKVRICLLEDQEARAVSMMSSFGLSRRFDPAAFHEVELDETREHFAFSRIAILMHQGALDDAIDLLDRLCAKAACDGYVYGHIRFEAALATCHWRRGDQGRAFGLLGNALQLTENRGFSRAVLDDVAGLPALFSAAVSGAKLSALPSAEYFRRFRDVLACDPHPARAPAAAAIAPAAALTHRELDLLRLLSQGLSNRDISERCRITLFTTKWHLKNVFAKLGVSTRMEALFRAQQMQLLDPVPSPAEAPHAQMRMGWRDVALVRGRDPGARARRNTSERDLLARDQRESAE